MCSRYELSAKSPEIAKRFQLDSFPPMVNAAEIRPSNQALIVDEAGARLLRWGFQVSWDKKPVINARAESLAEKKTFKLLLDGNRCLVPTSAYFEWRRDGKVRRKNRIAPVAGGPFAFAGLTNGERFTIVTCLPSPGIAHIHNRMPVILAAQAEQRWLDLVNPYVAVADLLRPYGQHVLVAIEEPPSEVRQLNLFG
ncbi:MAG: SOS response-associated peptidase [Rhodospirillales bacterium]